MTHHDEPVGERWKSDGVQVIKGDRLDPNTAQTPGMFRQSAINHARVGAQKIWAGTVTIEPNAKTGVHHHGALESVIFVLRGRARMRWGERLEYVAEAEPGDFIYVPPFVPHQEINADPAYPLKCVLVRSDNMAMSRDMAVVSGMVADFTRWSPGRWIAGLERWWRGLERPARGASSAGP